MSGSEGTTLFAFIKKRFLLVLGWICVFAGLVIGPLPGPGGIPLLLLGTTIVLTQSFTARRNFVKLNRRYPKWIDPLRKRLRKRRNKPNGDAPPPP